MTEQYVRKDNMQPYRGLYTANKVLVICCALHHIPLSDLLGKSRCHEVSQARKLTAAALRIVAGMSTVEIGVILRKSHSAVQVSLHRFVETPFIIEVLDQLTKMPEEPMNLSRREQIALHCQKIEKIHKATVPFSRDRKEAVRKYMRTVTDVLEPKPRKDWLA